MSDDLEGLALEFAPVFAQKVTREWAAADHITGVDLAGGVADLRRNPGHLMESTAEDGSWSGARPEAQIYYSACETGTHVFLLYAVYHAMDWWKRFEPDNLYDLIRDGVDEHAHDISFYCDDIHETVSQLEAKGVEFTAPVEDEGFGLVTTFLLPDGQELTLYEPKYEKEKKR